MFIEYEHTISSSMFAYMAVNQNLPPSWPPPGTQR